MCVRACTCGRNPDSTANAEEDADGSPAAAAASFNALLPLNHDFSERAIRFSPPSAPEVCLCDTFSRSLEARARPYTYILSFLFSTFSCQERDY